MSKQEIIPARLGPTHAFPSHLIPIKPGVGAIHSIENSEEPNGLLAELAEKGVRTYIPERRQKGRCWTDKPMAQQKAFRANRRRVRGKKGRQLNRQRSERCERTFAHVCETGGGRRTWLRGQTNVSKMHTLKCAAYNLGLLLRKV